MDQIVAPAPIFSSSPSAVHVVFQDYRPQFRRLVFRGALFELITVGFYRFWLATDIRRYLWRATSVEGDTLEYTGVAKELFFGALLALAIFAPLYLAYFLVGVEAERQQAFASIPFGLFFYLFAQFALFRARRYRMTRTVWRGVRFWMTGSGWDYAWRSAALMLLVILTLGLALPWRAAILERFKMRRSHYGDLQGHFDGTGWEFFKKGFWLWLLYPGIFFAGVVIGEIAAAIFGSGVNLARTASIVAAFMPFIWLLTAPFWYAAFKAIEWRWWISGIRFGEVSFSSELRPRHLFGIYWKVVGWFVVIFSVLSIAIGGILGSAVVVGNLQGMAPEQMAVALQQWEYLVQIILCYVVAVLMMTAVMRIYLTHDLAWRVAALTTVHNIEAAQNVSARGAAANAVGEGLADSLDVFGF